MDINKWTITFNEKVLKNRMATDQRIIVLNKTNTVSKFEEN